ncbi:MAG: PIG-L family deacetylase [Bacteroidia bacterium]
MKRILFFILSLIIFSAFSQSQQSLNSAEILQALKKLNTVGTVLYVAAHPDDENTRLLSYLSKELNLRTGYLSLTRGDGGQNLIGKEQGEELGLIRTQELLAARKIDGAEQFFTRANDFGFSKNPEETLAIWNKDSVLADMVWCIRNFKPDVIICRFPTTGEGGHGHHTASAILAQEAFEAAADPKRFPKQLAYTQVWQTKRLFWNTFNFGTTNTTAPNQLKMEVGAFNKLLGKSYGEVAAESRSMHKSQGFGSPKTRGQAIEYFKQLKGDSVKTSLFEGINQTWERIEGGKNIKQLIENCISQFNAQAPEKSIEQIVSIYRQLQGLSVKDAYTNYWKLQKLKEVENVIIACAGVWIEATASDYIVVPGNKIDITAQVLSRNEVLVKLNRIKWSSVSDTALTLNLKQNELYSFKHKEPLPLNTPYSTPYWLEETHGAGLFTVKNNMLIGKPENDAVNKVLFEIEINGLILFLERPIVYKFADPVKGEIYRPLEVLPPVTVNIENATYMFTGVPQKIKFTIKANTPNIEGTLEVKTTNGWEITLPNNTFKLLQKNDEQIIEGIIPSSTNSSGTIEARLKLGETSYSKSISRITYDHIPAQFILNKATAKLITVKLEKNITNIAYIPGAGDNVASCLQQVGYTVTILKEEQLEKLNLTEYAAIITGVRLYNTSERIDKLYDKLMEYVSNGGNLIVQYNTNSRVGPLKNKIGPFPFTISRDRVTDENARVDFLNPDHRVLHYPNKITKEDFDGWKQERGLYFATELDKNYESIFSMNDKTEQAHEGSLIIAKYGKGNFVYTGLAFFRQLPAGVPGAYRLFTNIIELKQ